MENKENGKKEYTGMKAAVIEFNMSDVIATSGEECHQLGTWGAYMPACITNEMN